MKPGELTNAELNEHYRVAVFHEIAAHSHRLDLEDERHRRFYTASTLRQMGDWPGGTADGLDTPLSTSLMTPEVLSIAAPNHAQDVMRLFGRFLIENGYGPEQAA